MTTTALPRKAFANRGLRCRELAVEIVALNDLDPWAWKQDIWVNIIDGRGESVLASGLSAGAVTIELDGRDYVDYEGLAEAAGVNTGADCRTAGCIAGWATLLNNEPVLNQVYTSTSGSVGLTGDPVVLTDGRLVTVATRAAELLCLPGGESNIGDPADCDDPTCERRLGPGHCDCQGVDLFHSGNDRATVVRLLAIVYGISEDEFEGLVEQRLDELTADYKRHEALLEAALDDAAVARTHGE